MKGSRLLGPTLQELTSLAPGAHVTGGMKVVNTKSESDSDDDDALTTSTGSFFFFFKENKVPLKAISLSLEDLANLGHHMRPGNV